MVKLLVDNPLLLLFVVAAIGYPLEQTHNDLPNIGYATVYPVATIAKILLAQLILTLLL